MNIESLSAGFRTGFEISVGMRPEFCDSQAGVFSHNEIGCIDAPGYIAAGGTHRINGNGPHQLAVFRGNGYTNAAPKTEADRLVDDLLAACDAVEFNAEECLDFDECTAMLVSIDDYHKLMEVAAKVREVRQ